MIQKLSINTTTRNEMIDITDNVAELVKDIKEGIVTVYCPHTTAAITINENADPDVKRDILKKLSEVIPENNGYRHAEGNSDSHIKVSLTGPSQQVIIKNGQLILGTWQSIFFCEFDGPRNRNYYVQF